MKPMNPKAGRALVTAFERSTKRVGAFCEERGVSYAVLKYWRNRIAELDDQQSHAFVQIESTATTTSTSTLGNQELPAAAVVILPNQTRIAFQQSSDVTPSLIEALSRC